MKSVSKKEILGKIRSANPWWGDGNEESIPFHKLSARAYFGPFYKLAVSRSPHRAILLMGPRRVGKTVLLFHSIRRLIRRGFDPETIIYIDIQQPVYNGMSLEELFQNAVKASGRSSGELFVFFDEIQYLRDWEVHLKALVDSHPNIKFVASGSAAATLRLKSIESGAGRFTDFFLPPLTFYEYLALLKLDNLVRITKKSGKRRVSTPDIAELNEQFVKYLNYGGYPEALFFKEVQADPGRFIRSDIIDKVLLKDLPSLYGIQDIQELNSLFTSLAYNTANEVSLSALSQNSGVAKNTIKRYIEYLESAFLIRIVHRVDRNAKKFQRATAFKVYLTNPSMRSALFSPISADDDAMGHLVETAVFSQWFHALPTRLHYARWQTGDAGEVDIVCLDGAMRPAWAVEVKWSDAYEKKPHKHEGLIEFCRQHECPCQATTRTVQSSKCVDGQNIPFVPSAVYCYVLGYNIIRGKKSAADFSQIAMA